MSSLAADTAAFKKTLHSQNTHSWHSNKPSGSQPSGPQQPPAGEPSHEQGGGKKKKRPKNNIVYSQPADTGTGLELNTQLLYAVNHLKSSQNPMRLQDIAIITNTPLDTDTVLLEKFKAHDRVELDPKTGLYSFRHDFTFRNKAALLTEIQRATRRGGGLSVRSLKESWKEAPAAIEELEKDNEVYVTRTLKDGQMRMVFWNEVKPNKSEIEEGKSIGFGVDTEFNELWHKLKVPNDVDLLKELENEGLQVTAAETVIPKGPTGKKKGKKSGSRNRPAKLTNTHLISMGIDLSKDYVPPGK